MLNIFRTVLIAICSLLTYSVIAQCDLMAEVPGVEPPVFSVASLTPQPAFDGGDLAMYEFISKERNYPKAAKKAEISGVVYVRVIVGTDGSLTNICVRRGLGYGCDEEAVRVLAAMPKWIPGKSKGEIVRSELIVPILFGAK
ncbi:MAG: energy transducer TonB [Flavobacteriales bacterium]|nr:energy transducer TonB [Flavobacteriales bacterium]